MGIIPLRLLVSLGCASGTNLPLGIIPLLIKAQQMSTLHKTNKTEFPVNFLLFCKNSYININLPSKKISTT